MQNSTVLRCYVGLPQQTNVAEGYGESSVLDSSVVILSREEKDYQLLVNEKLKASAEWDVRDSRMFSIG